LKDLDVSLATTNADKGSGRTLRFCPSRCKVVIEKKPQKKDDEFVESSYSIAKVKTLDEAFNPDKISADRFDNKTEVPAARYFTVLTNQAGEVFKDLNTQGIILTDTTNNGLVKVEPLIDKINGSVFAGNKAVEASTADVSAAVMVLEELQSKPKPLLTIEDKQEIKAVDEMLTKNIAVTEEAIDLMKDAVKSNITLIADNEDIAAKSTVTGADIVNIEEQATSVVEAMEEKLEDTQTTDVIVAVDPTDTLPEARKRKIMEMLAKKRAEAQAAIAAKKTREATGQSAGEGKSIARLKAESMFKFFLEAYNSDSEKRIAKEGIVSALKTKRSSLSKSRSSKSGSRNRYSVEGGNRNSRNSRKY
jgi:hypothetical protein